MNKLRVTDLTKGVIPTVTTSYTFPANFNEVKSIQINHASTTASWSLQLMGSNDNSNFTNIGSAITVSNNSVNTFTQIRGVYDYLYFKVVCTKTSGAFTALALLVASTNR
jgi:hypothetical protein